MRLATRRFHHGFTDYMANNHTDIEKRLWASADELRANSKLKSSEPLVKPRVWRGEVDGARTRNLRIDSPVLTPPRDRKTELHHICGRI